MIKIILDTNVIISALISKSKPFNILFDIVLTKKVETCLSDEIYSEYLYVMKRDKFSKYFDFKYRSELIINQLFYISKIYKILDKIDILKDKGDNKFLELSRACQADYLITGNIKDFEIKIFEKTKIITPSDFWEEYYDL